MNKETYKVMIKSKTLLFVALGLLISLSGQAETALTTAIADEVSFEEGVHYATLEIPIRTRNPDKIELAEYFSYGCPHCYQFEPHIAAWQDRLADDVNFVRTPAIWNADYQVYAQTYYTAQALKVLGRTHTPLFNALHEQRQQLNNPTAMANFFVDYGVSAEDFAKAYNSFGVRASVQQADSKGRAYRSGGVPAIIVNGKYRVEGSMAGSFVKMLQVADYLLEKERKLLE